MRCMNKRAIGTAYERLAARYLVEQGYRILHQNYRCRTGEIDVVAQEGRYLVFVEVKYRRDPCCGDGQDAVDARKRHRICRTALWYLAEHRLSEETPCRFDVVAFAGQRITLLRDAFPFL